MAVGFRPGARWHRVSRRQEYPNLGDTLMGLPSNGPSVVGYPATEGTCLRVAGGAGASRGLSLPVERTGEPMKRIWLENYRCFRERQEARLAPLTLLVGDNSTGKTSFLAMVRALWDVAYRHRMPNFKEDPYDLGSFDEIAHFRGGRGGRAASFAAGFQIGPRSRPRHRPQAKGANQADNWTIEFSKRGTAPLPVTRRLANKNGKLWVEHRHDSAKVTFTTPRGQWEFGVPERAIDGDQLLPLFMLWQLRLDEAPMAEKDQRATRDLVRSAEPWSPSQAAYAGAPVRSRPRRTYDPAHVARDPEGDYVPMFLANQYFEGKKHWTNLTSALEEFGKSAGLFDQISVKPLGKQSGPFQIQIRRFDGPAKGPHRNLIDVGYGVSQVLPIVTELLRQDAADVFLLQQPEVHLHPRAQAALGSLLCHVATWDRQLIIETHSDHLLDRVRMDVRDGAGSLKPEDVSILYFERGSLDVRIHSLRIDQEGNILDAPPTYRQFFMEEVKRTLWKREPGK